MTRRLNGALALAVLVLAAVVVSASFAATSATPGVTSKTITIGGTFPLTGPVALYSVIPKAEAAYFAYVNAHGGVNKRQIIFKYYDDGYNPANTVPLTKKLVQQDHVFAVYGSLGTAPTLATRDYLNQNKVPQVLVATGDSYWGAAVQEVPVDDRLPARLSGRVAGLRTVHQEQGAAGEDRRPHAGRRLRRELLQRPRRRASVPPSRRSSTSRSTTRRRPT